MAKRSQRRPVRHEKDHSGCVWGLISIFDFRQGRSTRKFLSDKRHRSSRHPVGAGYSRSRLKSSNYSDEKCQENDDDVESKTLNVENGKTSVKKLMEKELSGEQQTRKQIPSFPNSECGRRLGKNRKQTNMACKVACDIHGQDVKEPASLESQESCHPNSVEQFSHLDLAALMEEFCSQIHYRQEMHMYHENGGDTCDVQRSANSLKHKQLDELDMELVQKHSILQQKLSEAAEVFLNQKFIDAKQLTQDEAIHQSKQFMDALEILNSNKELLLKLLQDSNSLLVKHIQDLQNAQSEKVEPNESLAGEKMLEGETGNSRLGEELVSCKQVEKQNIHNFFRRKIKAPSRNPSKGGDIHASNQAVGLNPGLAGVQNSATETSPSPSPQSHYSLRNQGHSGRFNSQFSLNEIKRKLKHAMGESRKERHWISMEGILHKIPYKRQGSGNDGKGIAGKISGRELPSEICFDIKRATEPSISGERGDKKGKPTDHHPSTGHEVASITADSCNLTWTTDGHPMQRESSIYIEAKKHLAKMLSNGDEDGVFLIPRTLGRISSPPGYLSPVFSPVRDRDHTFVTAQMRFSPNENFRLVSQNIWRTNQGNNANHRSPLRQSIRIPLQTDNDDNPEIEPKKFDSNPDTSEGLLPDTEIQVTMRQNIVAPSRTYDDDNPETKPQEFDSNPDTSEEIFPDTKIPESICSSRRNLSAKGDVEILEITDVICQEEGNFLNRPSISDGSTPIIRNDKMEIWEEEESFKCLGPDSPTEDQPPSSSLGSFPPSTLLIQKVETLESINDRAERPSPVSVLEPFFLEEVISPESTDSQLDELPMQPRRIHFEEQEYYTLVVTPSDQENYLRTCMEDKKPTFEYVRAVMQASGLSWDELLGKDCSSDQPLDPSLFDEVDVLSNQLCGDQKLIFDCINEVLVELYTHYFGCSPWVVSVNSTIRPVPMGKKLIREVWKGINWHLRLQHLPHTLDQIIGKDMEKARSWMELQCDVEGIGTEIGEDILEELMDGAIFDLCC